MDASTSFGQWLKKRRKERDLTQWDLAARVGCAEGTIQKIEADERRPSKQVAALLLDILGVPADQRGAVLAFARNRPVSKPPSPEVEAPAPWRTTPPALAYGAPLTQLIGRDRLVASLRAALRTGPARLVTLTGPPGVGKTRVAQAICASAAADYRDGVYFVPLVAIREVALLPSATAAALGIRGTNDLAPLKALQSYLVGRELLLVLDNFEHILPAATIVADLLEACPALRILVTSRAALNVRGEQRLPVPPLELPDPRTLTPLDSLGDCGAITLFVERARMLQPNFTLSTENAAAVAAICARLDGLPLAIELAAARTKLLPPAALLARLEHPLPLLSGGPRDLPPRQQTLRAALAWSYDLLAPGEQMLFRRLGVFREGWTLPAMEAIGNAIGDLPLPILDAATALVDHSLVLLNASPAGEPRFILLETIREFAREQLLTSGEAEHVQRWHAEYFVALLEAATAELSGSESAGALARLEAEHGNIQEVFRWSIANEGAVTALRLGALYWRFCEMRGHLSEGRYWLEAVLNATGDSLTLDRGLAQMGVGRMAWLQGDYLVARNYTEQSVAAFRALDERRNLPRALHSLALQLGVLGDRQRARACYEESLVLLRDGGNVAGEARVLNSLGVEARAAGDLARASSLFRESLALQRKLGNTNSVGVLLANLGFAAYEQRDDREAERLFAESLALRRELGHRIGMVDCLSGLAAIAARRSDIALAARLFGAAESLAEAIGYAREPDDQAWYEREESALRQKSDPGCLAAAWEEGRVMLLDDVLDLAASRGEWEGDPS